MKVCKFNQCKRFLVVGNGTKFLMPDEGGLLEQYRSRFAKGELDGQLSWLLHHNFGLEILKIIKDYSETGRVPRMEPMLYSLAHCALYQADINVRREAYSMITEVCRIPTQLFLFVDFQQRIIKNRRTLAGQTVAKRVTRLMLRKMKFIDSKTQIDSGLGSTSPQVSISDSTQVPAEKLYCKRSTGWGSMRRRAIASFYKDHCKDALRLLYLLTKYKRRNNWSHKQILTFSHVIFSDTVEGKELVLTYIRYGSHHRKYTQLRSKLLSGAINDTVHKVIELIDVLERLKQMSPETDIDSLCSLIDKYGKLCYEEEWDNMCFTYGQVALRKTDEMQQQMPKSFGICMEHVPNKFFDNAEVWKRLLPNMALYCMIRHLNKMSSLGLFDDVTHRDHVIKRLTDSNSVKNARLHPLKILIALLTYKKGKGERGCLKWTADEKISDAMEKAFYESFKNTKKGILPSLANKRFLLAIDGNVTTTEDGCYNCDVISPIQASAALALTISNIVTDCKVMAFAEDFVEDVPMGGKLYDTVEHIVKLIETHNLGSKIDPSMVIQHAMSAEEVVDAFVFITASENVVGDATTMLQTYRREKKKPDVKLIVCAMSCNENTFVNDPFVLHICGFDVNMVCQILEFVNLELRNDCPCCTHVEDCDDEDLESEDEEESDEEEENVDEDGE